MTITPKKPEKLTPREMASKLAVVVIVSLVLFGGYLVWTLLSPVL